MMEHYRFLSSNETAVEYLHIGGNNENLGKSEEDFIEAHHLVPISLFKGQVVKLDPKLDFAVLCSNCHRMIHKTEKPDDVKAFKNIINSIKPKG